MATTPARRKHSACLLRIRENCPFRKLRKNRCYDVTAASSACPGARWKDFSEHPISASQDRPISTIYVETPPPGPTYQPLYRPHQSQDPIGPQVPSLQPPINNQHRRSPSAAPSEASMDLDSGVDPETGERAES